jgi:hypothetical protein
MSKARWTPGSVTWRTAVTVALIFVAVLAGMLPLLDVVTTMAVTPTLYLLWFE